MLNSLKNSTYCAFSTGTQRHTVPFFVDIISSSCQGTLEGSTTVPVARGEGALGLSPVFPTWGPDHWALREPGCRSVGATPRLTGRPPAESSSGWSFSWGSDVQASPHPPTPIPPAPTPGSAGDFAHVGSFPYIVSEYKKWELSNDILK